LLKFIIWLAAVAGMLLGLLMLASQVGWIQQKPSFMYPTLILLVFSTAVIYKYLYKLKDPAFFVQLYLLLMVVKLIAYLGYNVFMVLKNKPGAMPNVLFFLAGYFAFTLLEIVFLYQHVNTKTKA
jgi:hypothetical protein